MQRRKCNYEPISLQSYFAHNFAVTLLKWSLSRNNVTKKSTKLQQIGEVGNRAIILYGLWPTLRVGIWSNGVWLLLYVQGWKVTESHGWKLEVLYRNVLFFLYFFSSTIASTFCTEHWRTESMSTISSWQLPSKKCPFTSPLVLHTLHICMLILRTYIYQKKT